MASSAAVDCGRWLRSIRKAGSVRVFPSSIGGYLTSATSVGHRLGPNMAVTMEKDAHLDLARRDGESTGYATEPSTPPPPPPPPPSAPSPPPDGGFLAWLQCAAGFCVFFNTWGLLASFGT